MAKRWPTVPTCFADWVDMYRAGSSSDRQEIRELIRTHEARGLEAACDDVDRQRHLQREARRRAEVDTAIELQLAMGRGDDAKRLTAILIDRVSRGPSA